MVCSGALALILAGALCTHALGIDERRFLRMDSPALAPMPGTAEAPRSHAAVAGSRPASLGEMMEETSWLPRFVHILIGALAVAGMLVAVHGTIQRRRDAGYAAFAIRHGALWFSISTALQLALGFWLVMSLPGSVRDRFLGGSIAATVELIAGILLATGVLIVMTQAGEATRAAPLVGAGAVMLGLLLVMMTFLREQARHGYLGGTGINQPRAAGTPIEAALMASLLGSGGAGPWLMAVPPAEGPSPHACG